MVFSNLKPVAISPFFFCFSSNRYLTAQPERSIRRTACDIQKTLTAVTQPGRVTAGRAPS